MEKEREGRCHNQRAAAELEPKRDEPLVDGTSLGLAADVRHFLTNGFKPSKKLSKIKKRGGLATWKVAWAKS